MNGLQGNRGRSIAAISLIGIGLLFLLGQIFNFSIFAFLWPFFVIIPGLAFLYFAVTGNKGMAGLAVPGTVITGTGLILLYQSLTNHWASWAYAWTLYPLFVGLAMTFMGQRMEDAKVQNVGRNLVRGGGIAFIAAAAFFELVLFNGGGVLGSLALPVLLIGLGVVALISKSTAAASKAKRDDYVFAGPRVIDLKPKNNMYTPGVSDDLQRRIDAALAEDDEQTVTDSKTSV